MKEKWHIKRDGGPGICKAEEGKCPLGKNEAHYHSKEEAEKVSNEKMEKEYGLLPPPKKEKMTKWERKDVSKIIQKSSNLITTGFDHECLAGVSIAEKMGLENIAIVNQGEPTIFASMESRRIEEGKEDSRFESLLEESTETLKKYYEEKGASIRNGEALIRVIYYSDDPNKGIYLQSGNPTVLDAAIIKNGKIQEILEVKDLTSGAQMSSSTLSIAKDGELDRKSLQGQSKYIKEAIKSFNIKQAEGTNHVIDFGSKERNKTVPLFELAKQYKEKGATGIVYLTESGDVRKLSLRNGYNDIVKDMMKRKLSAEITLRANMSKRKMTDDDFQRFKNDKDFFKSEAPQDSDTFMLQDIKKEHISKSGKNVRIGSFVIENIEYKGYGLNMDVPISKSDMKAFGLTLIGKVYHNK